MRSATALELDGSVDAASDAGQTLFDGSGAVPDMIRLPPGPDAPEAGVADAPWAPDAPATPDRGVVVVPERWTILGASEDPFSDRPSIVSCSSVFVMAELLTTERVLGVDTTGCNYVTASQPTQRAIALGETIKVRLWHFELSAPEPAEAHAALAIDGVEVLNERIPIPRPGGFIVQQVRAERPIPEGAQVLFHLHNHGGNSWALVEVSAGP